MLKRICVTVQRWDMVVFGETCRKHLNLDRDPNSVGYESNCLALLEELTAELSQKLVEYNVDECATEITSANHAESMIKVQDRTRVKIQLRQSGSASVVDSQSKMEEAIPQTTGNGSAFQSFSEEGQTEGEMKAQLGNMAVAQFNAMWKCSDSRSDNSSTRLSGATASDNTKPAADISDGSMPNKVNQMSCDGTDDNYTVLPADKITSVYTYEKSQQLADNAKAFMTKGATWSNEIIRRDMRDCGPTNSADMLTILRVPRDLNSIHLVETKMQPDIEPKTNRTQCAITRLYDEGFDLHIVHGGTAGMLDTQTGTLIPMFKESDGFWYTYYVLAKTIKDTETAAQACKIHRILMDTGANYTLGSNKHLVHMTDKLNSRLSCRAAFGSDLVHGEKCGILLTWVLKSKDGRLSVQNNAEYKEVQVNLIQNLAFTPISEWELIAAKLASVMPAEVNMTLSSFMKDELVNSHQIVILGAKNQSSSEYRKMTALEFHCRQGHRGSVRSSRGRKYAYTFVDMGPTTYQEGFTLVKRSDLYDAFFPMIVKLRCRFQRHHNYSLCAELLVDKSNQISNQKSNQKSNLNSANEQSSQQRTYNTELKEFVMAGVLCDVKTPAFKGSNISKIARSKRAVSHSMMPSGVVKFIGSITRLLLSNMPRVFV